MYSACVKLTLREFHPVYALAALLEGRIRTLSLNSPRSLSVAVNFEVSLAPIVNPKHSGQLYHAQ